MCSETFISMHSLVCEGLWTDDIGGGRKGTVFQETRPGAGFKIGDFFKEKLGGQPSNDSEVLLWDCTKIMWAGPMISSLWSCPPWEPKHGKTPGD